MTLLLQKKLQEMLTKRQSESFFEGFYVGFKDGYVQVPLLTHNEPWKNMGFKRVRFEKNSFLKGYILGHEKGLAYKDSPWKYVDPKIFKGHWINYFKYNSPYWKEDEK